MQLNYILSVFETSVAVPSHYSKKTSTTFTSQKQLLPLASWWNGLAHNSLTSGTASGS